MTIEVTPMGDPQRHYWLALSMAKAAGADVVQAFAQGRLSQEDWAAAVQRCRGCGWAQGCRRWLDGADWGAQAIPQGCANRDVLEGLKTPA